MLAAAVAVGCIAGCTTPDAVVLRSISTGQTLAPSIRRSVYTSPDPNTADVYLTDLDRDDLEPGTPLTGMTGQIVHLRMFVNPEPGMTPIDDTACTVTIRHVVLADGQIGVYGGGGFLVADGSPGGAEFSGSIRNATMRLISSTDGFSDRLAASDFNASFTAAKDAGTSRLISRRLDDVLDRVPSEPQAR